ncbi:MAG: Gfo/Idh/MocA family oxidoreductase [Candidatus Latescibacteria bacterium]|nr:Gfo/Idh/MocA family oxidoreductase [Candidatus Latescibacterota bacterium]
MASRRTFLKKMSAAGIGGILASGKAPAFAQDMNKIKIGQIGLGSHSFLLTFLNPPKSFKEPVRCIPNGVWDDEPGVAEVMSKRGYGRVYNDYAELTKESDAVHIEHADYRKVFEFAQPALESGKAVFINRPFTATIADAEEVIRLARGYDAPVMSPSSLEFQPVVAEMQAFVKENGPIRAYEAYCPEPHFTWHFPHVINYAHAALGGGIESAYFTGDFVMSLEARQDRVRPMGSSLIVLTYKPRDGEPPIIGMNHIGIHPGSYHIDIYTVKENRLFEAGTTDSAVMHYMFAALHDFYTKRIPPRPYEAVLEQHRVLVAANASRLTGGAVKLANLGGSDTLPWSESIRRWLIRHALNKK